MQSKRVEAKFMGGDLEVDIEVDYSSSCLYNGVIRCLYNYRLPLKRGDKVSIYQESNDQYYIAMTDDEYRSRIIEPINKSMLTYAKRLHQMPIKDACFVLTSDKSIKKKQIISFMEGNDDAFAWAFAIRDEPEVRIHQCEFVGYNYDVLVHTNKEVGCDGEQTHIYEGIICKTHYPTSMNPAHIYEGTRVHLADDHDNDYRIILKDTIVDKILEYREIEIREQLRKTDDKYVFDEVYKLVTTEPDCYEYYFTELGKLCIIGDEEELVKAIMHHRYCRADEGRLSNWQVYMQSPATLDSSNDSDSDCS